jgi:hypothetical protein
MTKGRADIVSFFFYSMSVCKNDYMLYMDSIPESIWKIFVALSDLPQMCFGCQNVECKRILQKKFKTLPKRKRKRFQ